MTQRPPHEYDRVIAARTPNDQALQVQGDLKVTNVAGTEILVVDASVPTITLDTMELYLGDNDRLGFGDAPDVFMGWDGTDFDILPAADDSIIKFGDGTVSFDIWVMGASAAGYFSWDASANDLKFEDSVSVMFGTGAGAGPGNAGDVELRWDGTDLDLLAAANNTIFKIGDGTTSFDLWLFGASSAAYLSWDASANDLKAEDSVSLMFGTGAGAGPGNAGDVEIRWDGTDLDVLAAADDTVIKFGTGTNSFDLWWYGNTASDYVLIDASAGTFGMAGAMKFGAYKITTVAAQTGAVALATTTSGQYHISTGAVTYTLPAVATAAGCIWYFAHAAAGDFVMTAPADTLVAFNDATATSLTVGTNGEEIGFACTVFSDGSLYYLMVNLQAEAVTTTVA